ncbi:unnamed protein product [Schistosoma margrebowiei]|uniref:Uncharacterized protein n=1 Tax=Schistosoma margrebowiei TaxID=48269 RepID=A0A183MEM4_9TREM|nr:unnamed protein product [Schistosoma margrebowiei]
MMFGDSQQETLDPRFVLFGTRQQVLPISVSKSKSSKRKLKQYYCMELKLHKYCNHRQEAFKENQNQLDDLDFADDLALLSHTHEQMQIETASVAAVSELVGLNINKGETKILKCSIENSNPITLDGESLENVESLTYLGSIIDEHGGSDAEVDIYISPPLPPPPLPPSLSQVYS